MTLLERAQGLELRVRREHEHEVRGSVAETVRARTKNLETHVGKLATARARAAALEAAGRERSSWPLPPVAAFDVYRPKGVAPISVESTRQREWEKFVTALGKFVERVEKLVGQDIKRAKRSALDDVSLEDLSAYLDDPSTETEARQLLGTLDSLEGSNWETMPAAELLQALQRATAFREQVARLRENGASAELLGFLGLVRNEGAPLSALTGTLRTELDARKLFGRLRLVLK
jgi:hypothetical protein